MSEAPQAQLQQLRRMQLVATGLLVGMAVVYVIARTFEPRAGPWLGYVRAFAEAAMIGALADWFAIVALFRHPLGVPLPHTAVIPRRKNQIGGSLGRFVATHFLTVEVVSPRLAQLDLVGTAAAWLSSNARRVADGIAEQIPRVLDLVDDEAVFRFLHKQLVMQVSKIDTSALAGRMLEMLTEGDRHKAVLCETLRILDGWMMKERNWLWRQVRDEIRLPDWPGIAALKDRIADFVADMFVNKITTLVHDLGANPKHSFHAKFRKTLDVQIAALKNSPTYRAKGEEIKQQLLNHPAVTQYVREVWQSVERWTKEDLAREDSRIRDHAQTLAIGIGRALSENAELREKLNASLRSAIVGFVVRYRHEVENIIRETVAKWEAEDICANLEREVGRDLQFIRINGTLVGGSVGVVIHVVSQLVWQR